MEPPSKGKPGVSEIKKAHNVIKDSGGIRITGTTATVAIGFGVIAAAACYFWGKKATQQQHLSSSGYVVYCKVKVTVFVLCWPALDGLSVAGAFNTIVSHFVPK
jgi:hypothetical protein